ncbi:MAG TPA: DUF3261 domain-containing protein [Thermoanaerobaculia bacterium]|nr:DUF3261 domain-containing protein [Thermoanaerobaculia bacterium]
MSARRALALLAVLALASCRTGRPSGVAVEPLSAATREEAVQQLRARRESFRGMRSLMRVRATTNGKTQSFRAQLVVHDARRMELIAYTPVGTTAMTMKADGDRITTDPAVPPASFNFLRDAELAPAEVAMLILGVPPRDDLSYVYESAGLQRAVIGDIEIAFDPPAFPAKHVVVTRGADRVEIEHLEVMQ